MDHLLLDAFRSGDVSFSWADVESEHAGHRAVFRVFADAATVGGIRRMVSAEDAQKCADAIGGVLLTPKLIDLRHQQATVKIPPHTQPKCPTTREAERKHSQLIDHDIARAGHGMVSPVGKHWCLYQDKCPALYGWGVPHAVWSRGIGRYTWAGIPVHPSVTDRNEYVIQPPSTGEHSVQHFDYSMYLLIAHGWCEVDGQRMRTAAVYTDAELCGLAIASAQPLAAARYSGVPLAGPPASPVSHAGAHEQASVHDALGALATEQRARTAALEGLAEAAVGQMAKRVLGGSK